MSDKKNIDLNQYSGKKEYPELQEPTTDSTPRLIEDYQALEDSKRGKLPRFRIVDKDGKSYGCSYNYLVDWVYDPKLSVLILTFSNNSFTIEGKKLGKIETYLMEEKVKTLREFNDNRHKKPSIGEPVIESITIN